MDKELLCKFREKRLSESRHKDRWSERNAGKLCGTRLGNQSPVRIEYGQGY